jgi:hypothetical protein
MSGRRLKIEADEPAVAETVLELLDELALATNRREELEQQHPEQLLGRNRRTPGLPVEQLVEGRLIPRDWSNDASNGRQRVIGRHPILEDHHREQDALYTLMASYRSSPSAVASVYQNAGVPPAATTAFSASC